MPIELPPPIAGFFAAGPGEALALCFAEDAVVTDEGRLHRGRAAIAAWKAEASRKYDFTSTPFAVEASGGRTVVTAHVAGNFPGSPVDLRYFFTLDGEEIAALEVRP